MCQHKLLFRNKFGQITQCGCSARIQLSFGNFVLGLSDIELDVLKTYIPRVYEAEKETATHTRERSIYLSPSIDHLMLAFSIEELEGLMDLLNQASLTLEVQKILNKE